MKKSENSKDSIYLPYGRLDINKQLDILKTLHSKYNKNHQEISYKDIGGINASNTTVSGTLSFYADIQWLIKNKNKYVPSGMLIHYFSGIDKEKARDGLLKLLLDNCKVAAEMEFFIKQQDRSNKDKIIKYIGSKFNFLEKNKNSIIKLLDLLVLLDIFKKDEEDNFFIGESKKVAVPISISNEKEEAEFLSMTTHPAYERVNICIGIILTPEINEEQMRRSIKIILEEIEKTRDKE